MGESLNDAEMKQAGKRQREELSEEDPEEQARKYATVEVEKKDQSGRSTGRARWPKIKAKTSTTTSQARR